MTSTATATGYSAKEGTEGQEVVVYMVGAKTFLVTFGNSGMRMVFRIILEFFHRISSIWITSSKFNLSPND